jgi:hypothetical protein
MTVDSDTCIFESESIKTLNRNIYFIKEGIYQWYEGMAKFYVSEEK